MEKTIKAFVARDKNKDLYFYKTKPTLRPDGTFIGPGLVFDKEAFAEIQDGEYTQVTITYDHTELLKRRINEQESAGMEVR
jgi:hypothetical protein